MSWYNIDQPEDIDTPGLLVYPDRIHHNITQAIAIVQDVDRLRPHVKTHKMIEVGRMQVRAGITRFKCATLAEAEMMALAGARDVLIAYQLVGSRVKQYFKLKRAFPNTVFSSLVDCMAGVDLLLKEAGAIHPVDVFIDVDVGQGRTGIRIGQGLEQLTRYISAKPILKWRGYHAYDGHIREPDLEFRSDDIERGIAPLLPYIAAHPSCELVAGGSPSFGIHARSTERQCSPGTFVFWDHGYQTYFPEYPFQHAAVIATRIISKLDEFTYCLDLGHKHVAAEGRPPHIALLDVGEYEQKVHSEEHLVIRFAKKQNWQIGDLFYGIPRHICPTVALYPHAHVIVDAQVMGRWMVTARDLNLCNL